MLNFIAIWLKLLTFFDIESSFECLSRKMFKSFLIYKPTSIEVYYQMEQFDNEISAQLDNWTVFAFCQCETLSRGSKCEAPAPSLAATEAAAEYVIAALPASHKRWENAAAVRMCVCVCTCAGLTQWWLPPSALRHYCRGYCQSWALPLFLIFSLIKNFFFAFFIKLITYFCTSPI